jgi:hypothetical protein
MKELLPPESAVKLMSDGEGIRSFQQDGKKIQQAGRGFALFYQQGFIFNEMPVIWK